MRKFILILMVLFLFGCQDPYETLKSFNLGKDLACQHQPRGSIVIINKQTWNYSEGLHRFYRGDSSYEVQECTDK